MIVSDVVHESPLWNIGDLVTYTSLVAGDKKVLETSNMHLVMGKTKKKWYHIYHGQIHNKRLSWMYFYHAYLERVSCLGKKLGLSGWSLTTAPQEINPPLIIKTIWKGMKFHIAIWMFC